MTDAAESSDSSRDSDGPSLRRIAWDAAIFTVLLVGGVGLAGYLFRDPLQLAARWLIERLGFFGMSAGVFLADALTIPIPVDVYLVIGVTSDANPWLTLLFCSVASVAGGNFAYFLGPYIERIPILREKLSDFRARGELLFDEWGVSAVAIAALTPVPFSVVSWLAGIYGMRYRSFFLASLVRIPRISAYYALYQLGWAPSVL